MATEHLDVCLLKLSQIPHRYFTSINMFVPRGSKIIIKIIVSDIGLINLETTVLDYLPIRRELTLACNDDRFYELFREIITKKQPDLPSIKCGKIEGIDGVILNWFGTDFVLGYSQTMTDDFDLFEVYKQLTIKEAESFKKDLEQSIKEMILRIPSDYELEGQTKDQLKALQ